MIEAKNIYPSACKNSSLSNKLYTLTYTTRSITTEKSNVFRIENLLLHIRNSFLIISDEIIINIIGIIYLNNVSNPNVNVDL